MTISRILSLVLTLVTFFLFASCSNSNSSNDTNATTSTTAKGNTTEDDTTAITASGDLINLDKFAVLDLSEDNIQVYREEVISRKSQEVFFSEEEENFYEELGYDVRTEYSYIVRHYDTMYYYPVVYRYEDTLILWYTDKWGSLEWEQIYGPHQLFSDSTAESHYDGGELISSNEEYAYVYFSETGKISRLEFGLEMEVYRVPENSVYCGLSEMQGFIFRNGTDVYAVPSDDSPMNKNSEATCIARGVKFVIDVNYDLSSDPWSQPLLLMEDGAVKAYYHWESEDADHPAGSPECLVDVVTEGHEGGYHHGERH